jgi:DNA-binding response OmpR family regulator
MGTEILRQEGFEVLGITDGGQVLESLHRFAPDLVLADVCMPHHSGYRICEQIKASPELRHVKVVLLASAIEPFDRAEAERVGADGVLHKPFEPSVVIETITPLMRRAAPSKAAVQPRLPDQEPLEQAVRAALEGERIHREQVRAAVVLAVESALPAFLEEITDRVMELLRQRGR